MAARLPNCFIASIRTQNYTRVKTRDRQPLIRRESLILKATAMDSSVTKTYYQNVVVMRHGDRMDNFDPTWVVTAERPWDPPLIHDGLVRAFRTGRALRAHLGFPIHRVFVSPSSAASRPPQRLSPPFVPSTTIPMPSQPAALSLSTHQKSRLVRSLYVEKQFTFF